MLLKEYGAGYYQLSAWYISNRLCDLPIRFFNVITWALVAYWTAGLRASGWRFVVHVLILYLSNTIAWAAGSTVSLIFWEQQLAEMLNWTIIWIIWLSDGFWQELPHVFHWLHWTSYSTYAHDLLDLVEFKGTSFAIDNGHHFLTNISQYSAANLTAVTGDQVLEQLHIDGIAWRDTVFLLLLLSVLQIVNYFLYRYRLRSVALQ